MWVILRLHKSTIVFIGVILLLRGFLCSSNIGVDSNP